jgi:hypothetical protein
MRLVRVSALLISTLILAVTLLAEPVSAATPALTIGVALEARPPSHSWIRVNGTLTCSQPTGQANLLVSGVQFGGFAVGAAGATVTCAAGPVPWTVVVFSDDFHQGQITINGSAFLNGVLQDRKSAVFNI